MFQSGSEGRTAQQCAVLTRLASPVLSNIYLDRLDQYVGQRLLPEYNLGRRRRPNPAYQVLEYAIARARRHKDRAETRGLILRRRQLPSQDSDVKITRNRRAVNGAIGLFVPRAVIRQRCALYMSKGKPAQRGALLHDDDFTIVAKYQAEYAGLVQYYLLAQDVFRLGRLHWVMETSLLKTLAGKHRSTVN